MVGDPIGDLIVQIKNAYRAGKASIVVPHSKLKEAVARILARERYLSDVRLTGEYPKKMLVLSLRYEGAKPVLTDVRRKSKPGLRTYVGVREIPTVLGGRGVAILSTPQGIMTGKEARKKHLGGELLCEVW